MTKVCGIRELPGAIALKALLLEIERIVGRATETSIELRQKRGARKPIQKRCASPLRWTVYDHKK